MDILRTIREMKDWSARSGGRVGFVPTMGSLHAGHLTLVHRAKASCDRAVASIFLNPAQFGAGEDLAAYPVDPEGDRRKLEDAGTDALFLPDRREIYPQGFKTYVQVEDITSHLCGVSRPAFFRGVATVVLKLLNIVQPHTAFFGEKDWQQLQVVRTLARDLSLNVNIESVPTVRDADGVALSSRNAYLSETERVSARSLVRSLDTAKALVSEGEISAAVLRRAIREIIERERHTDVEYISICDPADFTEREEVRNATLIALAVRIGRARLIDNCIVEAKRCNEPY
jgi:pantoate--beta-alanine ligase